MTAVSLQRAGVSNLNFASNLKVLSEPELSALQSGERHRLQALSIIIGSKESETIMVELFRSISVLSHVFIAPGVELQIDPQAAGLSPEQLRAFVRTVMTEWEKTNAQ